MKVYNVALKEEYPFLQGGMLECVLRDYPYDDGNNVGWKRPALIVIPGGGYGMVSKREGEPIATAFMAKGFQTFVLWYMTAPDGVRYPEQLLELGSAVDYVKKHADELMVNPDEIFAVGFSAGGHLCANLAVAHQELSELAGVTLDAKPTAVGLSYPVISKKYGHVGSHDNLLKGYSEREAEALIEKLSLDEAVSEQTPPAFIWTTSTDRVVPAENAIRYALALADKGIDYELHVYPHGIHGLSTVNLDINAEQPHIEKAKRWIDDCAAFFRMYVTEKF